MPYLPTEPSPLETHERPKRRSGWVLDTTINLQNLLTIATFFVAGAVALSALERRISALEIGRSAEVMAQKQRDEAQRERDKAQDQRIRDVIEAVHKTTDRIERLIEVVSKRGGGS